MVVLRAIGGFFARIGRWIRDTAWVQPLLIVGGIFAIIFSIPSITSWVQSWFTSGDASLSFYYNNGYRQLTNGESNGVGSDADRLLSFIFSNDEDKTEAQYNEFGKKFFVTFVQEECSTCKSNHPAWQAAIDNWGRAAGFHSVEDKNGNVIYSVDRDGGIKIYTIFVDQLNSDDKNIFWKLHDTVYQAQFANLATLENPYKANSSVSYEGLASSEDDDLSGGTVFTTPTTFLFDKDFADQATYDKGYTCANEGIKNYKISEILFDIPDSGSSSSSGTSLAKARTLWDCWNHLGKFNNQEQDSYISK